MRARAAARTAGTRREVEQSIARFEKRLDDANAALKTLSQHLGSGARGSYKEVTSALTALRRNASKTNKQALKDFDKVRTALTQSNSSSRSSRTTKSSSGGSTRSGSRSTSRSTSSRSSGSRSSSSSARSGGSRSSSSRSSGSSRAKKS